MQPIASLLFAFLVLCCFVAPCRAEEPNKIFQWAFNQEFSASLPSCKSLAITVKPFNSSITSVGIAPYFMASYPINDPTGTLTPHLTPIGSDPGNLAWTVDQPINSTLLLYVVDSAGSSGGVPTMTYTVTTGQSTQCIQQPQPTPSSFYITANVTDSLSTCQPWGISIFGGLPPYNVTFAAINSPVVTNVSMDASNNAFTYINRADPGTTLIAAVSDLNGRWATGTVGVKTFGNKDTTCTGLGSSAGTVAENKAAAAPPAAALSATKSRHQSAVVAGVVVTLIVLLLVAGVGGFLYMRRRRVLQAAAEVSPRKFEAGGTGAVLQVEETGTGTHILSINSFIDAPTGPHSPKPESPGSSFSRTMSTNTAATTAPFDRRRLVGAAAASVDDSGSDRSSNQNSSTNPPGLSVRNPSHRPAGFSNFPTASVRRSAKSVEAGLATSVTADSEFYDLASTGRPIERSMSAGPASALEGAREPPPMRSSSVGANTPAAQEIIFQHQDAGIVRELPPPYLDRGESQQ